MADDEEPAGPEHTRRGADPRGRALLRAVLAHLGGLPDPPHDDPPHDDPPHDGDQADPDGSGSPGRAAESVASALADAFLAGEWSRDGLLAGGAHVLGGRRAWLRSVAAAVLSAYRRAPLDRPRELAGFVAATPAFRTVILAAPAKGQTVRVAGRLAVPTSTVRLPWPVPRLDDIAALADFLDLPPGQLDWFADRRGLERRVRAERLRHYRYSWMTARGGARLLEAPKPRLKAIQRRLLSTIVGLIPPHDAAHGFRPGRSVATFAAGHAGQQTVLRLDLEGFFAHVTAARVYGMFRTAGYPEPVAHTLTALVTVATPVRVLSAAPRPADPARIDAHRRLLNRLAAPHLPQGAPTSPALANLSAFRLDRRLAGLAATIGATYTRYADDLAFSGDRALPVTALVRLVGVIAAEEGFRINVAKTSVRRRDDRQLLGGLVVNERPAVPRDTYDQLRAILHNAARTGPEAQNRDGHLAFRAHLLGRIAWVAQTHPDRGIRLRRAFNRITW
jgi:RNA-directed DNA polymerase